MSEVTETELATKAKAPRVSADQVAAAAQANPPQFHVFEGSCMTVCCLTLPNGFNVVGTSACADKANFDPEIGQRIAFSDATGKIWPLLGYALREQLHAEATNQDTNERAE